MRLLLVVGREAYLVLYTVSTAFQQPVEMLTDVRRLRRRVRQRYRLVERDARFVGAAQLVQPRTFRAEEMEVTLQLVVEWLDHVESSSRAAQLCHSYSAIERDDRRRLQLFQHTVERVDLLPVRISGTPGARVNGGDSSLHLIRAWRAMS